MNIVRQNVMPQVIAPVLIRENSYGKWGDYFFAVHHQGKAGGAFGRTHDRGEYGLRDFVWKNDLFAEEGGDVILQRSAWTGPGMVHPVWPIQGRGIARSSGDGALKGNNVRQKKAT